ncbi:MAG: LexA family transcriptional regulator [Treponema sp.]|jgi:SOS-response transcriptional repressor LexA|nr:LexA family transcriptional regulator [Treponema sp.]
MKTEAEKYAYIQERSGLSKKEFALSLGLSKEQGSMLSRGKYKPSREVLIRLAQVYNIDLTWFIANSASSEGDTSMVSIELIDQAAAAGPGLEIEEYANRRLIPVPQCLIAPYNPSILSAVSVSGDSMIDEKINDKDIVIFRKSQAEGNGIYVVSLGNTLLVKRVAFDNLNKTVLLISANSAYAPREISGDELESLKIEGHVIACLHRF